MEAGEKKVRGGGAVAGERKKHAIKIREARLIIRLQGYSTQGPDRSTVSVARPLPYMVVVLKPEG